MTEKHREPKKRHEGLGLGLILMAIGFVFLLDRLDIARSGEIFVRFWPVALVAVGIKMLLDARPKRPKATADNREVAGAERLRLSKTFGSIGVKIDSKNFSGGKISTMFGDVLVDLSDANIRSGEQRLKLKGLLGDISVALPKNVKVSVRANTIFGGLSVMDRRKGGFAIRRKYQSDGFEKAKKRLIISASQVMGDVTISKAFN